MQTQGLRKITQIFVSFKEEFCLCMYKMSSKAERISQKKLLSKNILKTKFITKKVIMTFISYG